MATSTMIWSNNVEASVALSDVDKATETDKVHAQ